MERKFNVIKCPICGREYHPSEIFVPKYFFGTAVVRRDEKGKIIDIIGDDMDLSENYCCDNCNTTFNISSEISFSSDAIIQEDMSDHRTKIPTRFKLVEI